jgi:hypothetical protein
MNVKSDIQADRAALKAARSRRRRGGRTALGALAMTLWLLALASSAFAGPPVHLPLPGQDIEGLNHACGTAVDSEGDVYVSSAGESKVKVFDAAHNPIASLSNANEPCGLAVDTKGTVYVVEQATGEVVKYIPNVYPLTGSPAYGGPMVVDSDGDAKGISVDPTDDRLYVAKGDHVSVYQADGTTGQDEVQVFVVNAAVTAGTFTLSFEGQPSAPIPYDAKPSQVQAVLEAVPAIGAGNVTVEESNYGTGSYEVKFTHPLGSKDVPSLTADSSGLTGGGVESSGLAPAIQGYSFSGSIGEGNLSSASAVVPFTYSSDEKPRQPRHYLFVADTATDEVAVFSGADFKSLTFSGTLDGKDVPDSAACTTCSQGFDFGTSGAALAIDWANGHVFVYDAGHGVLDEFELSGRYLDQVQSASFANGGPTGIAVLPDRSAMQELTIFDAIGGTFTLSYEGVKTTPLAFNSSAATIQAALETIPAVGSGNVVVRQKGGFGRRYQILFINDLAHRKVARIAADIAQIEYSAAQGGFSVVAGTFLPGYGPGGLYITAGSGVGANLLAFGPLAAPSRATLGTPLSRQLKGARAVATDSHGDVYVIAGPFIHVYGPDGTEIAVESGKGIPDAGGPTNLAVDSTGKLYVREEGNGFSSEKKATYYTPSAYPPVAGTTYARHEPELPTEADFPNGPSIVAVNPANDHLFVANFDRVVEFDSAANGSAILNHNFSGNCPGARQIVSLAVNGLTGTVAIGETGQVCVVDAAGTKELALITGAGSPNGLLTGAAQVAIDQSDGHILVFSSADGVGHEFDEAGGFVTAFGNFSLTNSDGGIAVDNSGGSGAGNVYIAYDDPAPGTFDVSTFGPLSYGEAPLATTGLAGAVGSGSATLRGTVDPRGFELQDCRFEYLTEAEYQLNGKAFGGAGVAPCDESLGQIGHGNGTVAVQAMIAGLEPQERYEFRLVAENEFGSSEGEAQALGPPVIVTKQALSVSYGEATLRALLDPSGLTTKYRFEYGKAAGEYDHSTPLQELPAGAGPSDVSLTVSDLTEGTTYHFRVLTENGAASVAGPDQELTTLTRRKAEACANAEFRLGFSTLLSDCRSYELITPAQTNGLAPFSAKTPLDAEFGNYPLVVPRGAEAGERVSFFTSGTLPGFDGNGARDGYAATRGPGDHPAAGWTVELTGPTYVQTGGFEPEVEGTASDQRFGIWAILKPALEDSLAPGHYLRTPSGFEPLGIGSLGEDPAAKIDHLGAGGSHVLFSSKVQLEDAAPPSGIRAIYDRAAGAKSAAVVSAPPFQASPPLEAEFVSEDASFAGSSEDGSTVAFKLGGALYAHDSQGTAEVAEAPNTFAGISEDGARVFYAATNSGQAPATLNVCDLAAGPCAGPNANHGPDQIAPAAVFVHVSSGGSVLFTSEEALTTPGEENENQEHAEANAHNLYAWAGGATSFIGRLSESDFTAGSFAKTELMTLDNWTAAINPGDGRAISPTRSTPDGGVFVFQSHARLTSYDNGGNGEIYRYDPVAAGERVACVSCDPSGALAGGDAMLEEIHSGDALTRKTMVPSITDSGGAVFFQSPDRLLPEDANDKLDVYEWKAKGAGSCNQAGGCLALISTGQGEGDSFLYGMSADGHDVFFRTLERLVGADVTGSSSLYDARIGGGIPEASAPAPCQGDACQGQGSAPPGLATPTSTGTGDGNEFTPVRCAKGGRLVKGRCIKRHSSKHRRRHDKHHRHANRDHRGHR